MCHPPTRYCAPELLLADYTTPRDQLKPTVVPARMCELQGRSDAWSLLVSWLELLSGMEPFWWVGPRGSRAQPREALKQFWFCMYETKAMPGVLDLRYGPLLSPGALAFFKEALVVDWRKRPTPAELLQHPYLSSVVGCA